MTYTSRMATWLRLLLVPLAVSVSPVLSWADEADAEAAIILAQLDDDDSAHAEPPAEALEPPGELPEPVVDDKLTDIELSTEEELLELEEAIPMCTTGEVYDGGLWYQEIDFVYLFKQPLRDSFVIADGVFDVDDAASMSTHNLKPRWRPGMRYTIGRHLGADNLKRDQSLEIGFFGLFDWQDTTTQTGFLGTPTVANPFMIAFDAANSVTANRRARLNSIELNLRLRPRLPDDRLIMAPDGTWTRQCAPDFITSYFGGLRFIRFEESFSIHSVRTAASLSGPYEALQEVRTANDMVGFQFGTELIHQDCRWNWGLRGQLGIMINAAERKRHDTFDGDAGSIDFRSSGTDDQLAISLEMGLFAMYQLHPRIAARIAYDAMWLHGVAIAPDGIEQLGSGLTKDINAGENGIFHGLSLGLELRW